MGGTLDQLAREYMDFLPIFGFMPSLSAKEVERYVALGQRGWELARSDDNEGAEAAFRTQIAIFPPNPEPFVSLALLEAERRNEKQAVEYLRQAVLRGFTDLGQVQGAEAWTGMGRPGTLLDLIDVLPKLREMDDEWASWDDFPPRRSPDNIDQANVKHAALVARIDEMAPALGTRLTGLWKRAFDRALAANLQAYITEHPEAEDLEHAVELLMGLYAEGPLNEWRRLPPSANERIWRLANLVLRRFPSSAMRSEALVARATAWNVARQKDGDLKPEAVAAIRHDLGEVLNGHPGSPVLSTAAVGLIHTDVAVGEMERAKADYARVLELSAGRPDLLERVRSDLGDMALLVGGIPEFRAQSLDGDALGVESLRGKIVILDFWATWCPPCIEEFPALRKIDQRHGDDVLLLGVNMDNADALSVEALRDWISQQRVPGVQLHDGLGWDSELISSFGVKEIPFNVVVAPDGEVVAVNAHGRDLERAVREAKR